MFPPHTRSARLPQKNMKTPLSAISRPSSSLLKYCMNNMNRLSFICCLLRNQAIDLKVTEYLWKCSRSFPRIKKTKWWWLMMRRMQRRARGRGCRRVSCQGVSRLRTWCPGSCTGKCSGLTTGNEIRSTNHFNKHFKSSFELLSWMT